MEPQFFCRIHGPDWPTLTRRVLDIMAFPISIANVERLFFMFPVTDKNELAANGLQHYKIRLNISYTTRNYRYNRRYISPLASVFLNIVRVKNAYVIIL